MRFGTDGYFGNATTYNCDWFDVVTAIELQLVVGSVCRQRGLATPHGISPLFGAAGAAIAAPLVFFCSRSQQPVLQGQCGSDRRSRCQRSGRQSRCYELLETVWSRREKIKKHHVIHDSGELLFLVR